jgi:hypothetical protein
VIDPASEPVFPNNVVYCLTQVLPGIDPDATVYNRPLRPTDPNYGLGVYATLWQPDENSYEIGHSVPGEATLTTYQIGVQTLIKDSDTERALAIGSIFTKRVRSVIYRNAPLRVALGSLSVADGTSVERMQRWGIRNQRFMSNDIEGKFVFISVLDLWMETEMS